jgi:cytochrome c biogenesis protein CcmG/thiol:disulfide interchange protein DsbE
LLLISAVWVAAQSPQKANLDLKDLNGRRLTLEDYKGKVLLINFWATWCPPCLSEIPDLVKWQRKYRAQGLRIVGITYPPQSKSEVRRFIKKLRVNYRIAMGTESTKAMFTNREVLPLTVVIDREGKVREVIVGVVYPDEFEKKVKPLITGER